jgi:hypothetical protein
MKWNIEFVRGTSGESQQAVDYFYPAGMKPNQTHEGLSVNHVQWYSHARPMASNPISAVNRVIHLNRCRQIKQPIALELYILSELGQGPDSRPTQGLLSAEA